jgi:hypothetical protein
MVRSKDGHDRKAEDAVLQSAQGEAPDLGFRGKRHASRARRDHRQGSWRRRPGCGRYEPPPQPRWVTDYTHPEDVRRGEWQDRLIDEREDQEAMIAEGANSTPAARHRRMRCRC